VLKVVPLLALAAVMLLITDTANLHPFAPHGGGALFPAISMVAWLFLGAESVTVPAEEIKDVAATIRRSAFIGFGLACVVYMAVATGLTLAIPSAELIDNPSPLAYAATKLLGPWGGALISAAALISILGVLNGWLLVTGRIPYSAARMGVAPAFLGALHARTGTPVVALIFSSALTAVLALSYFSQTILDAYTRISLAATNTALVTVGLTCAAYVVLSRREAGVFSARQRKLALVYSMVGVAVVLLLMAGSGRLELIGTAVCIVLPLPFFYGVRRVRRNG
jgi:APA family basic amino acid/polyamine antiporter